MLVSYRACTSDFLDKVYTRNLLFLCTLYVILLSTCIFLGIIKLLMSALYRVRAPAIVRVFHKRQVLYNWPVTVLNK
jgi:hypothetical protein